MNNPIRVRTLWFWLCATLLTGMLLASASTMPRSSSAQDIQPTFDIAPGVSEQDAGYAIEGIRLAQDFVVDRLGARITMPLHVAVVDAASDASATLIAVANEDRITIYAGSAGWNNASPAERYAVIVHEYTHFYQYLLLQEYNFDTAAWFDEGVAEFISVIAMADWGVIERSDFETFWATILELAPVEESMEELEEWPIFQQSTGAVYSLSYFAVAALFEDSDDLTPISTAFTLMGAGQSFDTAFTVAFGITPMEHYANIAMDLGAPPSSPDIPPDIVVNDPVARQSPVHIGSLPRTLEPGAQVLIEARSIPASICLLDLVDATTRESHLVRSTFADGTGDVYWFVTVPEMEPGQLLSLVLSCGGEPVSWTVLLT